MLNGIAPILIFNLPALSEAEVTAKPGVPGSAIDNRTLITSVKDEAFGLIDGLNGPLKIPIPIYLDEVLTGICVESEEKNIDINTDLFQNADGQTVTRQRGVNNSVTVHFKANGNSLILSALLAFSDFVLTRAVASNYSVSYFNGSTLILSGLIHTFAVSGSDENNLKRIVMSIMKTNRQTLSGSSITSTKNGFSAVPTAGTAAGPTR